MSIPVYEAGIYIGSGYPVITILTTTPPDSETEPIGYLETHKEKTS